MKVAAMKGKGKEKEMEKIEEVEDAMSDSITTPSSSAPLATYVKTKQTKQTKRIDQMDQVEDVPSPADTIEKESAEGKEEEENGLENEEEGVRRGRKAKGAKASVLYSHNCVWLTSMRRRTRLRKQNQARERPLRCSLGHHGAAAEQPQSLPLMWMKALMNLRQRRRRKRRKNLLSEVHLHKSVVVGAGAEELLEVVLGRSRPLLLLVRREKEKLSKNRRQVQLGVDCGQPEADADVVARVVGIVKAH
jgi:hypothetical protein